MADLLEAGSDGLPSDVSVLQDLIVQLIQGVLLCIVLWYALKVVLREPVQRATPAPDAHWAVALVSDTHIYEGFLGKG